MTVTAQECHTFNLGRSSIGYLVVWDANVSGLVLAFAIVHLSAQLIFDLFETGFLIVQTDLGFSMYSGTTLII